MWREMSVDEKRPYQAEYDAEKLQRQEVQQQLQQLAPCVAEVSRVSLCVAAVISDKRLLVRAVTGREILFCWGA